MKVTLLGCGTSVGVPALGHAGWGACDPTDNRNRRQRCSALVEFNKTNILIDAGPDIRNQLPPLGLKKIDAVLITHTHSDHVAGLDDLRAFFWPNREHLNIFATKEHCEDIKTRFPYLFSKKPESPSYFVPPMKLHEISPGEVLNFGGCSVDVFFQHHGNSFSLGFMFAQKFGYSTDVVKLEDAVLEKLNGVDLWIVEALRSTPHSSHSHYDQTFEWIDRVNPKHAVLTHLGLDADYKTLLKLCPDRTEPGKDGMVFEL